MRPIAAAVRWVALVLACCMLLVTPAAIAAPGPQYSQDSSTALTVAYNASEITKDGDASVLFRDQVDAGLAQCMLTSVSGATTITWYVSLDAAGDEPITDEITTTIVKQTATKGAVSASMGVPVRTYGGSIWIWHKTDAGTATAKCRVYWS
jgi:hypothetical protein